MQDGSYRNFDYQTTPPVQSRRTRAYFGRPAFRLRERDALAFDELSSRVPGVRKARAGNQDDRHWQARTNGMDAHTRA